MKRIISLLIVLSLLCVTTGCSDRNSKGSSNNSENENINDTIPGTDIKSMNELMDECKRKNKRVFVSISVFILLVIVVVTAVFLGAFKRLYSNRLTYYLREYNIDLSDQNYIITDFYHENAFTESWSLFSVRFSDDMTVDLLNVENFIEGVDSETSLWINCLKREDKLKSLSSNNSLKSTTLYNSKNKTDHPLFVIYDSTLDQYHFIFVSY